MEGYRTRNGEFPHYCFYSNSEPLVVAFLRIVLKCPITSIF